MKRFVLVAVLAALAAAPAFAHAADRGEAKAKVAGKSVVIDYGRPVLKGRDMLAQAEVGKPWRLGADAATTLKTEADLSFGGVAVPKGTYVLTATKVAADKWVLTAATNDAAAKKIAEVPLTPSTVAADVEQFTIDLKAEKDAGELTLTWGKTALKAAFTGK
jgi:opacity protein-like surface antigen